MTDTTAIVLSIIGTGLTASALLVTVIVFAWTNISKRLDELKGEMNRQFDEVNHRLERVRDADRRRQQADRRHRPGHR